MSTPETFGYRAELDRTLRRFASFAIGFSFISITTGIFTTYGAVLGSSGPMGIWTWPIVVVGQLAVALVFGSLAARMPLAGYSYQWASRLTNPYIGWLIGWLAFTFLIVVVASVDYTAASTVLPALLGYESSLAAAWLATALLVVGQALLIMLSTVWTERVNNWAVAAEIVGVGGITVLLLLVGGLRGDLHTDNLFSRGGLPAAGYFDVLGGSASPWMRAFLLGAFTIVGFEACSNLAEETENPRHTIPRAMWQAVVLSGVIGFAFLIALTLAAGDVATLSGSATPVADIVHDVLGDTVGTLLLALVLYAIFACGLVIFVSATRLAWAMSRDARFPAHAWLGRISPRRRTPLAATLAVGVLVEVILAVFAGSEDALFELFSAATLLPALIYAATVVIYAVARRRLPHHDGAFSMGRFEWPVIVVAVAWLGFELSIFRDPSFRAPWTYVAVMSGLGLIYLCYLALSRPTLAMPGQHAEIEKVAVEKVTA